MDLILITTAVGTTLPWVFLFLADQRDKAGAVRQARKAWMSSRASRPAPGAARPTAG